MPGVCKLTPEVTKSILDSIAKGMARRLTAARAGIAERTLLYWLSKGRKKEGDEFVAFFAAVKKAEAEAVAKHVKIVMKAANGTTERTTRRTTFPDGTVKEEETSRKVFEWTAAAWWLERNHPDLYGSDRTRMKHLEKRLAELEKSAGKPDA
jgi:hypothetical protein